MSLFSHIYAIVQGTPYRSLHSRSTIPDEQPEYDSFMKLFDQTDPDDDSDLLLQPTDWIHARVVKGLQFDFLGPVISAKITSMVPLVKETVNKRDELKKVGEEVRVECDAISRSYGQMLKIQKEFRDESRDDATFDARKASLDKWLQDKTLLAHQSFHKVEDELRTVSSGLVEALESLIDSVAIHKAKEEHPGAEADMFTELELLMAGVSVSKGEEKVSKGEEEAVKEKEDTSILSLPTLILGEGGGDDGNGTTVVGTPPKEPDQILGGDGGNGTIVVGTPPKEPDQIPTSEPKAVSPELMECEQAGDLRKQRTGEQKGSANGKEVTPSQSEAGDDYTGPSAPKPDSPKESQADEPPTKSEPDGEIRAMTPEETALAQIAKLEDGVMKSALLSIVEAQLAKAGAQSS